MVLLMQELQVLPKPLRKIKKRAGINGSQNSGELAQNKLLLKALALYICQRGAVKNKLFPFSFYFYSVF